jgi:hypothetical protein
MVVRNRRVPGIPSLTKRKNRHRTNDVNTCLESGCLRGLGQEGARILYERRSQSAREESLFCHDLQ